MKHYSLDPTHYFKSPGLAWDACLKETRRELELLHDYDMLMMFERCIRGGIIHISKDTQKQTINTCLILIQISHQHLFNILTQIIFTGAQCLKNFQLMGLNG